MTRNSIQKQMVINFTLESIKDEYDNINQTLSALKYRIIGLHLKEILSR